MTKSVTSALGRRKKTGDFSPGRSEALKNFCKGRDSEARAAEERKYREALETSLSSPLIEKFLNGLTTGFDDHSTQKSFRDDNKQRHKHSC